MPRPRKARPNRASSRRLAVVVLAAGEGTRMRSRRTKVLHELAGRPILEYVLAAAAALKPATSVVVVGHGGEDVRRLVGARAECVTQTKQLGSGHAALQAKKPLAGFGGDVLLLAGDVPLLTATTLRRLVATHRRRKALATVLGMVPEDPTGYGRIIEKGPGQFVIVEHADATRDEREIEEVNTSIYCFDSRFLFRALARVGRNNALGEYYLTDVLEMACKDGRAAAVMVGDDTEGLGINSRLDLARGEAVMQERLLLRALEAGVTFLDPATVYLSADARIGRDTIVGPNVRLQGATRIGEGCRIDGSCFLADTRVADRVHLLWGVVADRARIEAGARVGPFAHLRPDADLGENVHIGNFVEVKKSRIGRGSKANHLAYVGDSTVGRDVNIGAGTITCNYDGFHKHRTVIGDRVQIGSDSQLVAPVKLGADTYVAAGSTVTRDVEPGSLVFNVKPQRTRSGWVETFRKRSKKEKR